MEIEQTPLRTAIMRITSDMLDNPDKHGIYETGRFMDRIEQLMCDMMVAPEVMELSGSEAVMGLLAWLTTRDETTVLGPSEVVDIDLYTRFVETNNLTEPRESWHELLIHPEQLPPKPVPELVSESASEPVAEFSIFDLLESLGFQPMGLSDESADVEVDFDVGMSDLPQPDKINKKPEAKLYDGSAFLVEGTFKEVLDYVIENVLGGSKVE